MYNNLGRKVIFFRIPVSVEWSARSTQPNSSLTWHEVTQGLAGASHGDADHVLPGERERPALRLDWRGRGEALPHDLLHHVVWQSSLLERGDGSGDAVASHDGDLLVDPVCLDGLGVRVQQVRVRLVKVLVEGDERVRVPLGLAQASAGLLSFQAAAETAASSIA